MDYLEFLYKLKQLYQVSTLFYISYWIKLSLFTLIKTYQPSSYHLYRLKLNVTYLVNRISLYSGLSHLTNRSGSSMEWVDIQISFRNYHTIFSVIHEQTLTVSLKRTVLLLSSEKNAPLTSTIPTIIMLLHEQTHSSKQ